MADASKIIERIRANGANVEIEAGKLRIINRAKLPAGAFEFIRDNAKAIGDFLEKEFEIEERAAIIEFSGGAPRTMAEQFARICCAEKPSNWSAEDHAWFISRCAKIIDEAADIEADSRRAA